GDSKPMGDARLRGIGKLHREIETAGGGRCSAQHTGSWIQLEAVRQRARAHRESKWRRASCAGDGLLIGFGNSTIRQGFGHEGKAAGRNRQAEGLFRECLSAVRRLYDKPGCARKLRSAAD